MKHLIRTIIALLLLSSFLIQPLYAKPNTGSLCKQHTCQYTSNYKQIYDTMKSKMTKAPITGNPTLDFLYEMIPHHKAAIAMSQNILTYTNDAQVKTLAQNIITEQTKGVGTMEALLQELKSSPMTKEISDQEYLQTYQVILQTMLTAMAQKPTSCDVNVIFLEQMIPHHKGAIAMAENILKYTSNPKLKEIATQIIATQKTQLPKMESLIQSLKA
ncbi:MAG: DUF305 domain-containing protein [Cellulosilyticaceae bacterium]